jgi:hypothetical protein
MLHVYGISLRMLTFCRDDWMRIHQALRAHARDHYNKMKSLGEQGAYYEILWREHGICNHLADKIGAEL